MKPIKDRFLCRHLCTKTHVLASKHDETGSPCVMICSELTRSHGLAGEICPFEKYCRGGCPCPFYRCEKVENEQTLVPVWDLRRGKIIEDKIKSDELITSRMEFSSRIPFKNYPIIFSNLGLNNGSITANPMSTNEKNEFYPYECF